MPDVSNAEILAEVRVVGIKVENIESTVGKVEATVDEMNGRQRELIKTQAVHETILSRAPCVTDPKYAGHADALAERIKRIADASWKVGISVIAGLMTAKLAGVF